MNVLVTGGAGFIGSHAALRLLEDGHRVTVLDDLSRGRIGAIEALRGVGDGAGAMGDVHFVRGDCGDRSCVLPLLRERAIEVVLHFAALAYVGESVEVPLRYYRHNAAATLALLEAMEEAGVDRMIFSSSRATYGAPAPENVPISESCPQRPISPYGWSKLFAERMVIDHAEARRRRGDDFAFALLRYFNVAGCDRAGRLGEDHDPETHLVPILVEAALGRRDGVTIFGDDYETPDGTCIRDYVHVEDLVDAHVTVMATLAPGHGRAYNVGIGRGYSVREVVDAARRVTGVDFPVRLGPRRAGDPPALYADPALVRDALGWVAQVTDLDAIIDSVWRWRRAHPDGYGPG